MVSLNVAKIDFISAVKGHNTRRLALKLKFSFV